MARFTAPNVGSTAFPAGFTAFLVFHAFGKKYPGIEVNIFRSGTEEVVNKLLAENQNKNVLYQGREIPYTVDVKGEEWQIITNDTVRFGMEEVVLKLSANP